MLPVRRDVILVACTGLLLGGAVGAGIARRGASRTRSEPFAGATTDGDALAKLLADKERATWDALARRDGSALDTTYAREFVSIAYAASGPTLTSRRDMLAQTERVGLTGYALRDFRAVFAGDNVVVLTYRASGPFHLLATSVWAYRTGRWEMVFHQATAE